jgi:Tfp pilus assembly protein PilF/tRNA A-37 threonylcarbamoyl transferase component Bud32
LVLLEPTTVLPPPLAPQLRADRYLIRQFHARGGIGEIWLAEDAEIGRPVAVKRLRKKREDQQERFLVEAQVTGQLEHPGIVPVHDLGIDKEGRPFYVMTFVHGRTLKEVVEEHHAGASPSKDPPEVQRTRLLEIFLKVCQAVAYAHHRGVVHRDLKPDNVMLGPYGEALVLDWGMAKVRSQPERPGDDGLVRPSYSGGSTETQAGMVMGSPAYMAPEVAEGRAGDADERTDVYLLGATLYHILTGRAPREGSSRDEIVELARTVPPPPPRRLRPDVPRALEAICLKAMAHRAPDRYATALDLAADVQRYLAGAPVSAYREPLPLRAWRWAKRHRRALAGSLAAAAALGLGVLAVALLHDARQRAEQLRLDNELLAGREGARRNLQAFQRLAAERRFYAAASTPAGEPRLNYDSRRGEKAGQEALALAEALAPELERLALPEEGDALAREWHALLLLTVQDRCQSPPDRARGPELLKLLERAASLQEPSQSSYRLRARCRRARGEGKEAAEDEERAKAAPRTALDDFLEAEECRVGAASPAQTAEDGTAWRPNAELLTRAVTLYQRALRAEPGNFWCHLQLGRCYLSLGQGAEAREALNTCVALQPLSPWAYSARGLTLGLVGRYDDGEADLEQALTIDAEFRPALLNRGILAWLQGKPDQALADFTKVLEPPEDRSLLEAAYYRGQLHVERREHREALADFTRVVNKDPGFRPAYLSRAQVHFLRGDDASGLDDLTTFLDLGRAKPFDPDDPQLFARRGRLLRHFLPAWGLGDKLKLARGELEKALQRGHRPAALFDDLGAVWEGLGEPHRALLAYEQALRAAPPDLAVKTRLRRGWLYAQSLRPPKYGEAAADFAAVLRLDAENAEAHAGLGYVRALQDAPGEAQREAARAVLHRGGDYLILHNVACVYAAPSRADGGQAKPHQDMAMALLRRAVELARRQGAGPTEVGYIRWDRAFDPLHDREDYQALVAGGGR